mmetsp:Transcript_743/g.1194  ORF Transcript_743/g.1194 Transcript_743/m.1194 type:complete len:140 (-) Transcript_743:687-1106(-)
MLWIETELSRLNSLAVDLVDSKSLIASMLLRAKTTRTVLSIGFKAASVCQFRDQRISLKFLFLVLSYITKASVSIRVHSYVEHVSSILIQIGRWLRDAIIWHVTRRTDSCFIICRTGKKGDENHANHVNHLNIHIFQYE